MGKMFLMCGLSGAGKTTFAKQFAKENGYIYAGIDDFYAAYINENNIESPWTDPDASFKVWINFFQAIHEAEQEGFDLVIDTNAPTLVKRQQFIDWFPDFTEHNLIYIAVDEELREHNNLSRGRIVPKDEMMRMRDEFEEPVAILDTKENAYGYPEKHWDNLMVYINKNNNFIQCKYDY